MIPQGWNGLSLQDAQATCGFSCLASKCAPFFQIVSVIAAIFRANVRRAIAGFIPWLSKPWYKSRNGPSRLLAMVAALLKMAFIS